MSKVIIIHPFNSDWGKFSVQPEGGAHQDKGEPKTGPLHRRIYEGITYKQFSMVLFLLMAGLLIACEVRFRELQIKSQVLEEAVLILEKERLQRGVMREDGQDNPYPLALTDELREQDASFMQSLKGATRFFVQGY